MSTTVPGTRGTTASEVEKEQGSSTREDTERESNQDCENETTTTPERRENSRIGEFEDMTITAEDFGAVETRGQRRKERHARGSLKVSDAGTGPGTHVTLEEQEADEGIKGLLRSNEQGKCKSKLVNYDGLWYRLYERKGNLTKQLLLPLNRRRKVLTLAHECLMGGHMGPKKTGNRIKSCFYWPRLTTDVKKWCRTCDKCQSTIPKGKVRNVPMSSMAVTITPFRRVAIDLVGPFNPPSTRGNRYILTMVDYGT